MGGLFGSEPSQPATQTVTQTTELPPEIKPFLMRGLGAAETAFLDAPQQTEAQFLQQQLARQQLEPQGLDQISQLGLGQLERTAAGDFLFGGPGFNQAVEAAQRQIIPQIQSQFASAGRSGSGLAQQAASRALGDVFANQFQTERSRQLQAATLLPELQRARRQEQLSRQLGALGSLRNIELEPQRQATGFLRAFSGAPLPQTTSGTTQQQMFENRGSGLLGGILGIGSLLGGIF